MNCKDCKKKTAEKKTDTLLKDEIHSAVLERTIKRLFILLLIAVIAIFASNACWLYAWMQYDYESSEVAVEQDAADGGDTNYIGNNGDILNGLSESDGSEA